MKIMKLTNYPVYWMHLLAMFALAVFASTTSAIGSVNTDSRSGLAIEGYDPVAYFVAAEARPGDDAYLYTYQEVTWRFSSEANKQAFIDSPESYMPQYGGFCAYAASKNAIAGIDPEAWTIYNGRLYLNYSKRVRKTWRAKRDSYIEKADGYWPELAKLAN